MNRDWLHIKTTPWTLALILLSCTLLLELSSLPRHLDYWLYDQTITTFPGEPADDVAIVAIDELSLDRLGRWPWPRSNHAALIRSLTEAGAETIVFDILFPEPSPDDADLANAMEAHGNVILPVYLAPSESRQLLSEQLPARALANTAARIGHAHVELDSDGVARGLYLYNGLGQQLWPSLSLAAFAPEATPPNYEQAPAFMNIRDEYRAVPLAGGAGTVATYSYTRVLEQTTPAEAFRDKTVFVGATAAGFGDVLPTPFSGLSRPMSGVEFHASTFSALAQNQLVEPAPRWLSSVITLCVILGLALSLPRMRPSHTLFTCLLSTAVLFVAFVLALQIGRIWVPVIDAALIALLALPISSGFRLSQTNRFLNRQLDNLAQSPYVTMPDHGTYHPRLLLEHIQELFEPEGWILCDGAHCLTSRFLSPQDVPSDLTPRQWDHRLNDSWLKLEQGDKTFVLGLQLSNDLQGQAIQRYLNHLRLEIPDSIQQARSPKENISARIQKVRFATERLNQMQQFIRRSFEHMPDGIIVTDELGVIRFANRHIEHWFREPMPSLNGLPLPRLLEGYDPRESPRWNEIIAETLTLQQSRTIDLQIHGKDFLIHIAPFSLPDNEQSGLIANISDISELREQQRQHREAVDFISHDVRSPLVSQLALIEQLKRDPANIAPQQLEQLGRLARRSYNLAEEFVQLARAEQLTETRFYECELLAIAENARDSVIEQAVEKGIDLQLQGTEDLWLKGNPELLERALINLLTNAVQYSPSGSEVDIQVYQAGHQAVVTISDEGSGIDPEELPHLFDRYRRQRRTELSGVQGTGLGLSFVKTVVEKHFGTIAVASIPDQGSTFTLKLPILDPLP
ncbi:CHASE2 domain-containing protein [Marinobacter salinisoli]|uniref:histidine kinase n=1 Tax=Marinobacter salinisoli TaxID=2769486 RepID=A0ABX7MPY6_9GAMM|nr:CHASE2 domain-containing protein [Marinobacter salinisoli]QSP93455.1 CHASE2 domain-containing protein [Marinobacter salinisoli]